MINLNKYSDFRISFSIFFFVILIGVFAYSMFPAKYSVSAKQISNSEKFSESLSPFDFHKIIADENSPYQIIDIRGNALFVEDSFNGAINIETPEILNRKNIKKLKKAPCIILSDSEEKSHMIAFLLNQSGVEAIPVNGNYQLIKENLVADFNHRYLFYSKEKKAYDYQRFIPFRKAIEIEDVSIDPSALGGC